jgi:hypothetical protein
MEVNVSYLYIDITAATIKISNDTSLTSDASNISVI